MTTGDQKTFVLFMARFPSLRMGLSVQWMCNKYFLNGKPEGRRDVPEVVPDPVGKVREAQKI